MAIRSDDLDIRDAYFNIELGGNGDYYLTILEKKSQYDHEGKLHEDMNVISSVRVGGANSGGRAPHEVKMAVFRLYKALEETGSNKHVLQQLHDDEKDVGS